MKKHKILLRALILLTALAAAAVILWRVFAYDTVSAPDPDPSVTVTVEGAVTFFDGPGTSDALIFYPGAMVQHTAYAALLQELAAKGVDCFLVQMPLRMAICDINAADSVLAKHPYEHMYLGGHSLGGAMACVYAARHPGKLTGLVLLAAYSTEDLTGSGLRVLTIVGSEDGVINRDKLTSGESLLPADTERVVLVGGNHAQFGTYGSQRKDGEATLHAEDQRRLTCETIVEFIQR